MEELVERIYKLCCPETISGNSMQNYAAYRDRMNKKLEISRLIDCFLHPVNEAEIK